MYLFLGLILLFCDFMSFINNPFESKREEKNRKKRFKQLSFVKKVLLLAGYPVWRKIGHFWCLAVALLNVASQILEWIFADFSYTFWGVGITWLDIFTLIVSCAIGCIESFLYSSYSEKNLAKKIFHLLGASFVSLAAGATIFLFFYAFVSS